MTFITTHKPLLLVAAVTLTTLLSAGAAFAQDATPDYARAQALTSSTSSTSRADVQAQAAAFRASGEPSPWSSKYSVRSQRVAVSQPRAAVKADTVRALHDSARIDAGEVFSMGSARPAVVASTTGR